MLIEDKNGRIRHEVCVVCKIKADITLTSILLDLTILINTLPKGKTSAIIKQRIEDIQDTIESYIRD